MSLKFLAWVLLLAGVSCLVWFAAVQRLRGKFEAELFPRNSNGVPTLIAAGASIQLGVRLANAPSNLRFVWSTNCQPTESLDVVSTYTAPLNPGEATVTLTIMRGTEPLKVMSNQFRITASVAAHGTAVNGTTHSDLETHEIIITSDALPFDELGGTDAKTHIEGVIVGPTPQHYRVVLYVLTDKWYVQPLVAAPFTDADSNGKWSAWIHSGEEYAALLVAKSDANFRPSATVEKFGFAAYRGLAAANVLKRALPRAQRGPPR